MMLERQATRGMAGAALMVLATTIAACGSSSPTSGATAGVTSARARYPPIEVASTAIVGDNIPARYTCDGQDISPPLRWGAVPTDVRQLALFLVAIRPKSKGLGASVEWAVAGLSPALHQIPSGELPAGARLGSAGDGRPQPYRVCPAKGTRVHYQFELYGVPSAVPISARFSGVTLLSKLTAASGPTRANAHGGFFAFYERRR
jgi:phosphatidylethanolamine-binding protein (PEBP) family uncharacterized protein